MSCSGAPAANAAPAAAIAFWTFILARPPNVAGQQMRPRQLQRPAAVPDDDHVAELAVVEHDGPPAAPAVVVDHLADLGCPAAPSRTRRSRPSRRGASSRTSSSSALSTPKPFARHRLDDHPLHRGELLERVDPAQPEVIRCDVEHDGDVVALVARAPRGGCRRARPRTRQGRRAGSAAPSGRTSARRRRRGSRAARRSPRRRSTSCRPCGPCPCRCGRSCGWSWSSRSSRSPR